MDTKKAPSPPRIVFTVLPEQWDEIEAAAKVRHCRTIAEFARPLVLAAAKEVNAEAAE